MAGIGQYLKETRGELRHVAWPTRSQTIVYTALVIALSVAVSVYLGVFDFLFTKGLATFIGSAPVPTSGIDIQMSTTTAPVFSTSTSQ